MNILVIGSGGREHAICYAFAKSARVSRIFCAPGNAGTDEIAHGVPVKAEDVTALAEVAAENSIDLTFVGGESALAAGIVDEFESRGLKIIGPSASAARLESSKGFAKDFMNRHGVPTANYYVAESAEMAQQALLNGDFGDENTPVVVKADGLAAGKGVVVAKDRQEAIRAIEELESLVGRAASDRIVIEECLNGCEVSLIMFADGENFALMPPTRDHKRLGEGDTGPNTGGMGTFTDDSLLTQKQLNEITQNIIRPTLRGCIDEGFRFRGILFLGLMMTEQGPKLLEYNVRFGDPETQSILVRLDADMVGICEAMLEGRLNEAEIKWKPGNSATVVLAASGYPLSPRKGDSISGVSEASAIPEVTVFHAGTALDDGELVTWGGRVLGITATGESLQAALGHAYAAAELVSWKGMQFRRDIGRVANSRTVPGQG